MTGKRRAAAAAPAPLLDLSALDGWRRLQRDIRTRGARLPPPPLPQFPDPSPSRPPPPRRKKLLKLKLKLKPLTAATKKVQFAFPKKREASHKTFLKKLCDRVVVSAEEGAAVARASALNSGAARDIGPRAVLSREPWGRQGLTRSFVDSPAFRTTRASLNAAPLDIPWEQERAIVQAVGRDVPGYQVYVVFQSVLRLRDITAAAAHALAARDACQQSIAALCRAAIASCVARAAAHRSLAAAAARALPYLPWDGYDGGDIARARFSAVDALGWFGRKAFSRAVGRRRKTQESLVRDYGKRCVISAHARQSAFAWLSRLGRQQAHFLFGRNVRSTTKTCNSSIMAILTPIALPRRECYAYYLFVFVAW